MSRTYPFSVLVLLILGPFAVLQTASAQPVGTTTTYAGAAIPGYTDGPATTAQFSSPENVVLDAAGNVYVTDRNNNRIRRIDTAGNVTTYAGSGPVNGFGGYADGPASTAEFDWLSGLAIDAAGNLYVGDQNNHRIRRVDTAGNVTTLAGSGATGSGNGGFADGPGTTARFSQPLGVAVDAAGNVYVADQGNQRIRKIDTAGNVTTLAGTGVPGFADGPATTAQFKFPSDVQVDTDGNVYVADRNNHRIRLIDPAGNVTTLSGLGTTDQFGNGAFSDGPGTTAEFNFPNGIEIDAAGNVYVADFINSRIRHIVGIVPAPVGPDFKITVGTALAAPGDTIYVPVFIDNVDGPNVGGLQMPVVQQDIPGATFVRADGFGNHPGMSVDALEILPGTINFVLYSGNNSFIAPAPGPIRFATLVYVVDPSAPLGSTNELDIQGLLVGDELGGDIPASLCPGSIHVGIGGDINLDSMVNVLDVIRLSRILLETDPVPNEGTIAFDIADGNDDGMLNVADLVSQINIILERPDPPPGKLLAAAPLIATLNPALVLADGQTVIPLRLETSGRIAGLQVDFGFDPSVLEVGTPQLIDQSLSIQSHVNDGALSVIVYSLHMDRFVTTGQDPVMMIPVSLRSDAGIAASLNLGTIEAVTPQLQMLPVQASVTTQTVRKDNGTPTGFSLLGNAPNPFNPSTTISYEVPVQSHIRLIVYNMLGQEVVRLVDRVQPAGRYEVRWDARNASGQAVSSGIYMYRLNAGTGFSDTRRMTLLK